MPYLKFIAQYPPSFLTAARIPKSLVTATSVGSLELSTRGKYPITDADYKFKWII